MSEETTTKPGKKPQDHKKSQAEKVSVEFHGEKYEFTSRVLNDARTIRLVEKGQVFAALEKITSAEDVDRLLDSIEDEDGHTDIDTVGEFFETVFEAGDSGK
ncbi:MAG: hypothetical protein ACTHXG_14425 [Micrococcaceae bacterium]